VSGLLLSEQLKKEHGRSAPKIVLVSAFKDIPADTSLEDIGVTTFLEKPVSNRELRATLVQMLDTRSAPLAVKHIPDDKPMDFSGLRVLVAEDNHVNQLVIKGLLKKLGVVPDIVENGLESVEMCNNPSSEKYDLILMDCEMPEMDGWEATQQIRLSNCVRASGEPTRIYALSAHAMEHFVEKAKASGMDGYLPKPITLSKLAELLVTL
jgi:CheY-like chemotaxis protein